MTRIAVELPGDPGVCALSQEADALYAGLYPPGSGHPLDLATLERPGVTLLVARDDGRALGCAALVAHEGWGEIKRMFVTGEARRRGIGRVLLRRLEAEALASGLPCLRLEVGVHQPAAIGLYRASGFDDRPPYGGYQKDPLSRYMEKTLDPVTFRRAGEADTALLQTMVTDFHAGEGRVVGERTLRAVAAVATGEPLAEGWLIEAGGGTAGYVLLTRGWGVEKGGPDMFLDELYLVPEARGRGIGAVAMAFVDRRARETGAMAVFLVVAPTNERAQRLYAASGYDVADWVLMGRTL